MARQKLGGSHALDTGALESTPRKLDDFKAGVPSLFELRSEDNHVPTFWILLQKGPEQDPNMKPCLHHQHGPTIHDGDASSSIATTYCSAGASAICAISIWDTGYTSGVVRLRSGTGKWSV